MNQNICLFKRIFVCTLMLFMSIAHIFAYETIDSTLAKRMEQVDVSLLTCQPRDEIYALYGHTAIRVQDKERNQDFVVNYGVFDFRARFFIIRFVFGITDYMMGICSYEDFRREWNTGIYEQRINMTASEKARFLELLAINNEPQNLVYRYNYFYDNCATRARNILFDSFEAEVEYKPLTSWQQGNKSFRWLIHSRNTEHPWARLGNDILLGVGADANTSHSDRQFLPDVMCADFDSAIVVYPDGSKKPLIATSGWISKPADKSLTSGNSPPFIPTPTHCAAFILCAILALCIIERFITHKSLRAIRLAILALYGLPGIILFLMFFSQHPTVSLNLQILALNPLWLILAIPTRKMKYRWHIVAASLLLFFIGNVVQDYAEGVNILALGLFLLALNCIIPVKSTFSAQ